MQGYPRRCLWAGRISRLVPARCGRPLSSSGACNLSPSLRSGRTGSHQSWQKRTSRSTRRSVSIDHIKVFAFLSADIWIACRLLPKRELSKENSSNKSESFRIHPDSRNNIAGSHFTLTVELIELRPQRTTRILSFTLLLSCAHGDNKYSLLVYSSSMILLADPLACHSNSSNSRCGGGLERRRHSSRRFFKVQAAWNRESRVGVGGEACVPVVQYD